ncbi:hypothetical protein EXIGLDRAFT_738517 [Exidia glandulosa HHB12029]|uniref:Sister chromatid cohesion protein n=1 Tax=Exidia glandulosa HHB12029 TaxID=1314781 RepID=A0A165P2T7_EXIGL|nr:hypothetical protein EXIGLDRAFT_738517 [Exidia glandulosa HHB12029]
MNDGSGWYGGQQGQHGYHQQPQQPQPTDPRRTLAAYPFAATTPTSHVARHLNSLALAPSSHTFVQPGFYPQQHPDYAANPPPYSEYDQNPHLVAPSGIVMQQAWSNTPAPQISPYPAMHVQQPTHVPQPSSQWRPTQQYPQTQYAPSSSSSSLANALGPQTFAPAQSSSSSSLQYAMTEPKRPAPRPSYSSESSLSGALGPMPPPQRQEPVQVAPVPQHRVQAAPPPPQRRFVASESASFFDDFLARESQGSSSQRSQTAVASTPPSQSSASTAAVHHSRPKPAANTYLLHSQSSFQTQANQQPRVSQQAFVPQQRQQQHVSQRTEHAPPPRAAPPAQRQPAPALVNLPPAPAPIPPFRVARNADPPESPDPLALDMGPTYSSPAVHGAVTPRKRKPGDVLESPPKRAAMGNILSSSSLVTPSKTRDMPPPTASSSRSDLPPLSTPSTQSSFTSMTPGTSSTFKKTPYVELPRLPKDWITPSKPSTARPSKRLRDDDLGGYGSDSGDEAEMPLSKQLFSSAQRSTMKSSGKKTGDRDERAPLEKFTELLEEIFEAEDNLPSDVDPTGDPPSKLFSSLTSDWSRPMLSTSAVRKLSNIIGKVARPTKRDRLTTRGGDSPRKAAGLADTDSQLLSRTLKLLERSVRAGEDLDPFAGPPAGQAAVNALNGVGGASPSKAKKSPSKKKRARSKSHTPNGDEKGDEAEAADAAAEVSDADLDKLDHQLKLAKEAVLAADCVIGLLSADKLPKQLYSEELITGCLSTVKNLLDKVIYPFVEANSDLHGQSSLILLHVAKASPAAGRRALVGEIFQSLSSVFPRINALISRSGVAMSDKIIIQAVYISIGPFFVVEFGTEGTKAAKEKSASLVLNALGGTAALRGLRLSALALIRSIFANHSDQRSWIIEEILTSLIKLPDLKQKAGQFKLRDGHSIHTVSALLLQLVQTSAHDVRIEARKLALSRQQSVVLKRNDSSFVEGNEAVLTDRDREEIALYLNGLDSATKAAKTIVVFLTQRAGKGKNTKNTNEAEYRAIFDNLISDLLAVLFWPEWPSASLLLDIICKFMVASLDDVKSASANDSNGAKASALDHLGTVAARLRTSMLKFGQTGGVSTAKDAPLRSLDEAVTKQDVPLLDRLIAVHGDVTNHLAKRASEDQAYDSAQELTAASWGYEIAALLPRCESLLRKIAEEGSKSGVDEAKITTIAQKLKAAMRGVWKSASNDVFDVGTEEEIERVDLLAEEIGTVQGLKNAFDPILAVVLMALDSPAVFMRSKALRALGHIVTSDPDILRNAKVRAAIEGHLLDNSPAVRDAAVELIGKYIIQSPELATEYYYRIADRIADTGLGVRKRVIKLLKTLYPATDDLSRQVDIASRLVLRQLDEDDTVKDLATKTIEELWFSDASDTAGKAKSGIDSRTKLLAKADVIMAVTGVFKDRQTPLEDLLHRIVAEKDGKEETSMRSRYADVCDVLIEGLVDSQDFTNFNVVNCIKTVYLFSTAHPGVISFSKATTLLPYLKNPSNPEEQLISDYLLKIFRASIPLMPKTAAKFGAELQQTLQPMIVKPSSSGGLLALQETVACMCSVVQYLTHDYIRLVGLLKSCNAKIQEFLKKPADVNPATLRPLSILIFIVSLLTEHCDFDRVRRENPTLANDLNMVSKDSISLHVYNCLLSLYRKFTDPSMRTRLLQCLGFLFRAYPTLMTIESSAEMMDAIFASPEEDVRGRLLKIIQDFLISEAVKHSAREKESKSKDVVAVNMDKLVGNTHDFAESGVAAAIVQRYLPQILDAAVTKNVQVQNSAMDILTFTVKQGLAHPLQCLPTIIALETSPNVLLSTRANALHAVMHSKHASLVNMRYVECARKSFDYQVQICDGPVSGLRTLPAPIALFHRWYSLMREKRTSRQDFLKAIVRVFDLDVSSAASTQDDIDFARYVAENMATLDYKTQEEVLTIIRHLTSVLSVSGTALVELISPSNLLRQLHSDGADGGMDVDAVPGRSTEELLSLARNSVRMGVILLLKAHLKSLYSISEEKTMKWVPGKKSAVGDKPAVRRGDAIISWERMPFAVQPLSSVEDASAQLQRFLTLWSEDGVSAEPVDDVE